MSCVEVCSLIFLRLILKNLVEFGWDLVGEQEK